MSTIFSQLRARVRQRVWLYLDQRSPAASQQTLRQRALFVFPTPFGFAVLALVVLLYILGTNYQNNLVILLGYLLLVLCLATILLAFFNLHHLTVQAQQSPADVCAGHDIQLLLQLKRATSQPQALYIGWHNQPMALVSGDSHLLHLAAPQRGYYQIPRLKLQSVYPFGLVRCWSYVRLDCWYWVFPMPQLSPFSTQQDAENSGNREEWSGQRQYQPGDASRQLDWKRYSRQQQLLVHQYSAVSQPTAELWLSPDPRIENLEAQLSDLTARAQLFEQRAQPFGLRLARREVPIGVGPAHLRQVLQELALC